MHKKERVSTGLLNATQELRELIIANPDLPLLVFAGQDASCADYCYTSCGSVSASVGEYLDCMQTVNDEHCYTDRDEFQEDIENNYYDFKGSDEKFDALVKAKLAEYEPYWKKCIILYVDN